MSSFSIQAKDAYGNNQAVGGEAADVQVDIVGTGGVAGRTVEADISDNGDGTYLVSYTLFGVGT